MIQGYILFVTGCGCTKMERMSPMFTPQSVIQLPVQYPVAVRDWVNEDTDNTFVGRQSIRKFRLKSEDYFPDGITKLFIYEEIEG